MALPPDFSISTAASVANGCEVAAIPCSATATERATAMKSRMRVLYRYEAAWRRSRDEAGEMRSSAEQIGPQARGDGVWFSV